MRIETIVCLKLLRRFREFLSDRRGQDLIEYALVAALVGLGSVAAMTGLANSISNTGHTGSGIVVSGTHSSATISNNSSSIHGQAVGIDVDGGSASITNNAIYDNGIGVGRHRRSTSPISRR